MITYLASLSIVCTLRCIGQMITFAQFACVSTYGLFMHLQWPIVQEWVSKGRNTSAPVDSDSGTSTIWRYIPHLKPRRIPIACWMAIVVMFFSVSVLNNWSLAYKISIPLQIIFRSGGLMISMVLGIIWMKKRYTNSQKFAVIIVTLGVIYATTSAKANTQKSSPSSSSTRPNKSQDVSTGDYAVGIVMLLSALVVSSVMGLVQESTYRKYGSEWREGLFYSVSDARSQVSWFLKRSKSMYLHDQSS